MWDETDGNVECGWWCNGRLAVAGEFKANPLGQFIRLKYKFPLVNIDDVVVVEDELLEKEVIDLNEDNSDWETLSEKDL